MIYTLQICRYKLLFCKDPMKNGSVPATRHLFISHSLHTHRPFISVGAAAAFLLSLPHTCYTEWLSNFLKERKAAEYSSLYYLP